MLQAAALVVCSGPDALARGEDHPGDEQGRLGCRILTKGGAKARAAPPGASPENSKGGFLKCVGNTPFSGG